jgi:hypothetical protein
VAAEIEASGGEAIFVADVSKEAEEPTLRHDGSTNALIRRYREQRGREGRSQSESRTLPGMLT